MPRPDTLVRFIAQVCSGDHVGAIEAFYADHASMRENFAEPRRGKAALLRHEQAVLERAARVETEWVPPALVNGDTVAIRWRFCFTWKNGASTEIEEVAYSTGLVGDAVALGFDDDRRAQNVVLAGRPANGHARQADTLLADLVTIVNAECRALVAVGADFIQIDEPHHGMYHRSAHEVS